MTETYEGIRDHEEIIPRDVRVTWIEADQAERMLRGQYERLVEDGDLNDEAKARRAHELYEGRREGVERKKQAAKDGSYQSLEAGGQEQHTEAERRGDLLNGPHETFTRSERSKPYRKDH